MTKVKKDSLGLYINAGGYICRPFYGTCFREGDEVKAHHFGGSTAVGVGVPGEAMFKDRETFERWSTTGTGQWEKKFPDRWEVNGVRYKQWDAYVRACAQWYKDHNASTSPSQAKHNRRYAKKVGRRYSSKAYYVSVGGQCTRLKEGQ